MLAVVKPYTVLVYSPKIRTKKKKSMTMLTQKLEKWQLIVFWHENRQWDEIFETLNTAVIAVFKNL